VKITFFGLTLSSSWGNGHATPCRAIIRALHGAGHAVVFYEKDVPFYAQRRDLWDPTYCRLELYGEWDEARARALADARDSDLVIHTSYCPAGARIIADVAPVDGPLRIFYDLDTPITLSQLSGAGSDYLRAEQIAGFDLYLSFTGGDVLQELETRWGAQRARPLYGCVDPDVHARTAPREDFVSELSYMGTYAVDRQEKLDSLLLEPARRLPHRQFLLAGSLYPWQWVWPSNVRRMEHVAPKEHAALYSSSRLTLNITRGGMARSGWCPSGRFFEAAACGTPIVSDAFPGLDTFFQPGEEIIVAESAEDVVSTLCRSDEELAPLAARARQRTLDEHTGARRAQQLLAYCDAAKSQLALGTWHLAV
jgi:spore maturation protein CgeB